jgi:uncharacterized protein YukE
MVSLIVAELPQWLEDLATDLGTLWPIVLFVGAAYGLIKWITKKFQEEVKELIISEVQPIKDEFRNNGGSSFKDSVDRIEDNYTSVRRDLDHMKSDIDGIRSDMNSIAKRASDDHKALRDMIKNLEIKNDSMWQELQKVKPGKADF